MGAPGSGKGTQSAILASQFGKVISTGAILREESKKDTPSGFRLRQTIGAGELVDDAIVCEAVATRIRGEVSREPRGRSANPINVGCVGVDGPSVDILILDGFPRTVGQARSLDELLADLGMPGPLVLHLDVPGDTLQRRLASRRQCARCGAVYNLASGPSTRGSRCQIDGGALVERDDDSEGVVKRRITTYGTETLPVVDYYRKGACGAGDYRRIDGNRSAAEIAKDIRDIVSFAGITLDECLNECLEDAA